MNNNAWESSSVMLDNDSIVNILEELNSELAKRDKHLDITIYGGSSLCLLTTFRESTYDIDTLSSDNELLRDCLKSIGITGDLVNTEIDSFLNTNEDLKVYKEYSNLTVKLPSLEYLTALKCRACREKDLDDLIHLKKLLNIKSLKELRSIFIRFYSPIMFNSRRIKVLDKIFKIGEGK